MAEVIFDCTQFLTIDLDERVDVSSLLNIFGEKNDFRVIPEDNIPSKKTSQLRRFLHSSTFEIQNQEFIGEFDEWFELEDIPSAILEFGRNVQTLGQNKYIKHLSIILVRYMYAEIDDNTVFVGEFSLDNLYEGLYHASCFGNSGNIIVLRLFNTN